MIHLELDHDSKRVKTHAHHKHYKNESYNEFDWLLQIGELIHDQTIYILTEFDIAFFYVNDGRGEGVRQDEELGAFGH